MIGTILAAMLTLTSSVPFGYDSCDFFVHGVIREPLVCAGTPPQPSEGFMVFYDGAGCGRDVWSRARLDFLTEYVTDMDLSPAAVIRQSCGNRQPQPSDIEIDHLRFWVCRKPDFRMLANISFIAVVASPDRNDAVLRKLTFDIYAKQSELPLYHRRLHGLASELHLTRRACP